MSFSDVSGDLAKRLKQKNEAKHKPIEEKPVDYQELLTLRARILGTLIRDARTAKGYTVEECAHSVGVPPQRFTRWEHGDADPSLPQLELLAYELGVPVSHFWSMQTLTGNDGKPALPRDEYVALRGRVVSVLVKQAREEAGLSPEAVAEQTGIPAETLQRYESGAVPIPLAALTSISTTTEVPLTYFLERSSRVGEWLVLQEQFNRFREMPEYLQEFLSNPTNASFVELSYWFSQLDVKDLRGIAESILHLSRIKQDELREIAEGILNNITL